MKSFPHALGMPPEHYLKVPYAVGLLARAVISLLVMDAEARASLLGMQRLAQLSGGKSMAEIGEFSVIPTEWSEVSEEWYTEMGMFLASRSERYTQYLSGVDLAQHLQLLTEGKPEIRRVNLATAWLFFVAGVQDLDEGPDYQIALGTVLMRAEALSQYILAGTTRLLAESCVDAAGEFLYSLGASDDYRDEVEE